MRGNGSGGECIREWNGMWAELVASENVAHMNQDLSTDSVHMHPGHPCARAAGRKHGEARQVYTHMCVFVDPRVFLQWWLLERALGRGRCWR